MRRTIFQHGLRALALLALPLAAHAQSINIDKDKPAGLKPSDLVGGYDIVSGEKFGVPEPDDRIKGSTVRFTEDRVVVMDKDSKEVYGAAYKLERSEIATTAEASGATAARIRMTSKLADAEDEVAWGLVDKADDKVRLIYALPGADAPREFKTKDKQLMFVLKKKAG